MKKLLFVTILLFMSTYASAQITDAYIGVQAGVAIPVGDFGSENVENSGFAEPGLSLNFINFGMSINEKIGFHSRIFSNRNNIDFADLDEWKQRGFLVGPMYSLKMTNDVFVDLKPAIGLSLLTIPNISSGNQTDGSLAYSLGTQFRFKVADIISFTVSADYLSTESYFSNNRYTQQANSVFLGAGIAFIIK